MPDPDVAVQPHVLAAGDDDQVQHPIQVEVGQRRTACAREADDAGVHPPSTNVPSAWPISRLLGSRIGVVGQVLNVAFGDEQVDLAVVVHVGELGVPSGRGQIHVAGVRLVGGGAALDRDVAVCGWAGPSAKVCRRLSDWLVRKTSG